MTPMLGCKKWVLFIFSSHLRHRSTSACLMISGKGGERARMSFHWRAIGANERKVSSKMVTQVRGAAILDRHVRACTTTGNVLFSRSHSTPCRQRQPLLGLARPINKNKKNTLIRDSLSCMWTGVSYDLLSVSRTVFRHKVINIPRTRAEERTSSAERAPSWWDRSDLRE